MASWIFHLRAAERVLQYTGYSALSKDTLVHWYMGNLAPDCGVPVGFAEYVPSKDITHFKEGKHTRPEKFAEMYLSDPLSLEHDALWFYRGYCTHLLTDIFWVENVLDPEKKRFSDLYARDKKAFYALVKADWYDLDTLWLGEVYAAGKSFAPLEMLFGQTEFPNRYLDFFPADAFTLRLTSLPELYSPAAILPQLESVRRGYPVLTADDESRLLHRFAKDFSAF